MFYQPLIKAEKNKYFLLVFLIIACVCSCKKEYTKYPYNDIEKFVITDNNGLELTAAIQDNKIIIYFPPFQTIPDSIKPNITISDRAVISPASGVKSPFKAGLVYTVTAQDGSTKTYELQAAINQPPLAFTVAATRLGSTLALNGEYFIADTTNTKIYLINKDKKEIKIPGNLITTLNASQIIASITPKLSLDTGRYSVKLVSGKRTAVQGPILIDEGIQKFSYPAITTIKRGEEYTVTDTSGFAVMIKRFGPNINRGVKLLMNNTTSVPATVTNLTSEKCTIRIPADCPLGFFQVVYSTNENGSLATLFSLGTAKRITVTQ